jgi:hypothetical protein
MLKNQETGTADDFAIILNRYIDEVGSKAMKSTTRTRMSGINFIEIGFPGFIALIKVDSRKLPEHLRVLILKPNSPLIIGRKSLRSGTEGQVLEKILSNYRKS